MDGSEVRTKQQCPCKKECQCLWNAIKLAVKQASIGYSIKALLGCLFSIKKVIKTPTEILSIFKSKDSVSFGIFLGVFVLLYRTLRFVLAANLKTQNHSKIPLITGFVSGSLSLLLLQKQTRQSLSLFLMARALDIFYQDLVGRGTLPAFKYWYVLVYTLAMSITGYVFGNQPGCLPADASKLYLTFTNESLIDMHMRSIWIERRNNTLAAAYPGIERHNPLDFLPKLKPFYKSKTQ